MTKRQDWRKREKVIVGIVVLCKTQHGVIWIVRKLFWHRKITVLIPNVIVRSRIRLLLDKTILKEPDLKKITENLQRSTTSLQKNFKLAAKVAAPCIRINVGAKCKNPKVGQTLTNNLKSISGRKTLKLTDMPENGLRLKDMSINSKKVIQLNEQFNTIW